MSLFSFPIPKDSDVLPFYLPASLPNQVDNLIYNCYKEAKPYLTLFLANEHNRFKRMAMLELTTFFIELSFVYLEQTKSTKLYLYRLYFNSYITDNLHEELSFDVKVNHHMTSFYLDDRRDIFQNEISLLKNSDYNPSLLMALFLKIPLIETSYIKSYLLKVEGENNPFYNVRNKNKFVQTLLCSTSSIKESIRFL